MVEVFNSIPWFFNVALIIAVIVAITLAFFYWINKVARRAPGQVQLRDIGDITNYTLNIISLFYCIFVALIFIDVQTQQNQVQDIVVKEASILLDIYNTGKTFPLFDQVAIKNAVRNYAVTVMQQELPLMEAGKDYALVPFIHPDQLWDAVTKANPKDFKELALYQALLDRMNHLTDTRFQRFASVDGRTNPFVWTVLIYGGLIVIFTAAMFSSKMQNMRLLLLGFSVSLIVLVLLLIYSLDRPFRGPTAVSLVSFQQVVEAIKS